MNAILFQPTEEVRKPKKGEYYKLNDEIRYAWADGYISRPIVTRHEIPEEVAQRMMKEVERG